MLSRLIRRAGEIARLDSGSDILFHIAKLFDNDEAAATKILNNFEPAQALLINHLAKLDDPAIVNKVMLAYQNLSKSQPALLDSLTDAMSSGQMSSKKWIVDILIEKAVGNLGNILLCGGWFATLLLDDRLQFNRCFSVDIDEDANLVAERIHHELVKSDWKFRAITDNIFNISPDVNIFFLNSASGLKKPITFKSDTIINTSCEHMSSEMFTEWWNKIPKGRIVIVQSNNGYDIPGHINCKDNLGQFAKQTPMTLEIFSGEMQTEKYIRFMRIGYR